MKYLLENCKTAHHSARDIKLYFYKLFLYYIFLYTINLIIIVTFLKFKIKNKLISSFTIL